MKASIIEKEVIGMNTPTSSPEMTGIMMMPTTSPRLTRQNAICIDDEPFELPLKSFLDYHEIGKNPEKECLRALITLEKKIKEDLPAADGKTLDILKNKIQKINELVDCLLVSE